MTADLTQEPKDERQKLERALCFDFIAHDSSPDAILAATTRLIAYREAVLAEARPQWRKQVAEEIRGMKRDTDGFAYDASELAVITEVADFVEQMEVK